MVWQQSPLQVADLKWNPGRTTTTPTSTYTATVLDAPILGDKHFGSVLEDVYVR